MPRGSSLNSWLEREAPEALVGGLVAAGYSPLLSRLLASRGVSAEEAPAFFSPSIANLARPTDLPGVEEASEVILGTVSRGEKIVIFGDYDCDGVCASSILAIAIGAISKPGSRPSVFLPERLKEGYGMTSASVARMLSENPSVKLVITVDNGINSIEEVARLKSRGISVVVTDHHLPGDELPAADALVNPKVSAPPHLEPLCGAGVAFMLANALVTKARKRGLYSGPAVGGPLLVLAGLATVTDIMPIVGQNRILVSEALRRFRTLAPAGLKELYARAARSAVQPLTSRDFGFLIGPRINAAGRMATAMDALRLILSTDREKCRAYAQIVDIRNIERKNIEQTMLDEALSKIVPGAPAQVIDLPDGHQGVAGIVASRILERLVDDPSSGGPRPVCVVVAGHGSARAPEGYNVREAFLHAADALERFGGHAAAGGFSVKPGEVDRFRKLFCEGCAKQLVDRPPETCGASYLDAWVEPSDLTLEFAEAVQRLEPFGEGNPEPLFGLRGVSLSEVRQVGDKGRHLAVSFKQNDIPKSVWWNKGERIESIRAASSSPCDVVFTLEVSDYMARHAELRIVDISPCSRS
ncbi:MAG: DHH family phosphoesterase [Kiritimatiellae bacterium]|nr:DHH family phosphoesterase [Kiritimatiellia bacterium]